MDISERNKYIHYLSQFFHSLIFIIPIWIVYYQGKLTIPQISFLVSFQYIVQMLMELPSGAFADLVGRRNTLVIAFLIGSLSFLLFPFVSVFWHFLIFLFFVGVSDSFRSGAEEALLYDSFKEANKESQYGKVYGNGNIIYQAGLIIATALGGFLFTINNLLPYIAYGISMLFGTITVYLYIEPKIDSEKFNARNYFNQIKLGSKEIFKNLYTKYLSLFYIFVGGIAWSSTLYFNEFMMVDLGFTDQVRGYLTAGMRLVNVILIATVLKNAKIFNKTRTILFFPIVMLFAYLPGLLIKDTWGIIFIQSAMIATTARWIILSPLINQAFSSKYRATAISTLSLLIGVVYIFLTGISGPIIENYTTRAMYTLLGVFTLLTVVPIAYRLLKIEKEG